ncbi:MAG TPA: transketolase, partial [Pyrinomonadaceae bacterium]|nr:transketolase [Pyrinomonadaceae bacterium]
VTGRFEACGWHVLTVEDGNDLEAIEAAILEAQEVDDKPSLIRVKTVIGFGMPKQGTNKAHSDAPGEDAVRETKRNLGWDEEAHFYVPDEVYEHFRAAVASGAELEAEWSERVDAYAERFPAEGAIFKQIAAGEIPADWESTLPSFEGCEAKATRAYSGEVINAIAEKLPQLIGGSADLAPSNNTSIKSSTSLEAGNYQGRILHFGIREHAMGSLMNGMALYGGLIPFGGTFMTFSDYMRPAIRLAALSNAQCIYVFTHDSIGLGEDGPTHQSVEHIAALRAIPNLAVIRPADAFETREAWRIAINRRHAPTVIAYSRQKVALIDRSKYASADATSKGAYVLAEASGGAPKLIIIATGSEVGLAIEAREQLEAEGTPTRVVSMPCWVLFDVQSAEYRESVLPKSVKARLAVEAGVSLGWAKYVGDEGDVLAVDRFGSSAPADVVFREYGFTVENVVAMAKSLV